MTKQGIIEEVLRKINFPNNKDMQKLSKEGYKFIGVIEDGSLMIANELDEVSFYAYEILIFSHWFAKAFWGEEKTDFEGYPFPKTDSGNLIIDSEGFIHDKEGTLYADIDYEECPLAWQYHLQQMVLEKDPLKYLEKFL
jgi:hypothetical protein